jgi:DNA repair ATPase RecN
MAMTRGNGLSLSINTDLDMSQAQKTYRELVDNVSRRKLNIPLDVKIDEIVPKLDSVLNNKVGRKVEESFNRINTKFQNITRTVKKEFEEIGKDGSIEKVTRNVTEHLTKVTETFKNNIGDVKERVSIWGENNEYLASSLKNVQQGVENITTNTKSFYQIIDNVQTKVTEVTKTIIDTNGAEQKIIERTKEWTDANGKLHKTVDTLDADGNKLKATITTIVEPISQIKNSISSVHKFTSELGNLVTETITFNEKGEKLVTTVTEEEKGIGRLQKTTKVYNETLGQTVSTNIQLVNDETKLAQARKQQEKETQKQLQAQQVLEKYITQEKTQVSDMVGSYEALVTTTREVSASGKELITVVTQYTNSAGQLVTQVEKLDEAQRNVEATTITYEQKLQDVQSVVENTIVSIHKYQTELGNIVTETTTFNEKGEKIITTITEEDDGLGRLQRTTKVYNDTLKEVVKTEIQMVNDETKRADATTKVKDSTEKAAESAKKYNTYTKQAAKETRTFGQALTDALGRLVRYYIASLPIQAVRKTISETITTIKEFDSALVEFRKVSDLAGESLTRYVAKLAEMGEITGSTMQAMVEAAT